MRIGKAKGCVFCYGNALGRWGMACDPCGGCQGLAQGQKRFHIQMCFGKFGRLMQKGLKIGTFFGLHQSQVP